MYRVIDAELRSALGEMTGDERGVYVFLDRHKTEPGRWTVNSLGTKKLKGWPESPLATDYEALLKLANEQKKEIIFMFNPADDLKVAELAGHPFAMPLDRRDYDLLILVGEKEFETPTAKWRFDVPGQWSKQISGGSPRIAFPPKK